jgi:hypothetical protein
MGSCQSILTYTAYTRTLNILSLTTDAENVIYYYDKN